MMFEVLETTRIVSEKSRQARIDKEAVAAFALKWVSEDFQVPAWDRFHHYQGGPEETVFYFLVLDTLNFCFWPPPGKARWEIEYQSKRFSGYYALALSLKRAMEEGVPLMDADYLAGLSPDELAGILAGKGDLQLPEKRLEALHELGHLLIQGYDGRAHNLVASAGGSAVKLAGLLADNLSSFRDRTPYNGEMVFFYKRAQIFAADLYGVFEGKGFGAFRDMDQLTAFADYKLPQVLRQEGILCYDRTLARKVDQGIPIEAGSPEEVEIRANTLWAVEWIRQELERAGKDLRSFEIDWALWNMGQQDAFRKRPYHRTVTIFY